MLNCDELKNYLLSDFHSDRYKKISLLDIFNIDRGYFNHCKKKNLIEADAVVYFEKMGKEIESAGKINTDAFRILKYKSIIDEFTECFLQVKKPYCCRDVSLKLQREIPHYCICLPDTL